jgi:nucleotide-binding universal stress UspA family protein
MFRGPLRAGAKINQRGEFMLIKKILCPIDLSEDAKSGMAYAVSLAREHQAELVFFHVTRLPAWALAYPCEPNPFELRHPAPKFTIDDLFSTAAGRVQNLVHDNFGAAVFGLPWKVTVSLGNIPGEIVAAAVGEKADLIVMAKRKRGVLVRLFTRSVSEAVSELAPCPVLSLCPPQITQQPLSGSGRGVLGVLRGSEA